MTARALTPSQRQALDAVRAAHKVKVTTRADAEEWAAREVAKRVDAAERAESLAVRAALDAGVPRAKVGREGLLSADSYRAVGRSLVITEQDARAQDAAIAQMVSTRVRLANAAEREAWPLPPTLDRARFPNVALFRVDWPGYAPVEGSRLAAQEGSSVDLHGFVYNAGPRGRRWSHLATDDAERYGLGFLPLDLAVEDEAFAETADRAAADL